MKTEEQFIHIEGFMIARLGLKGDKLVAYAIVYGFSQGGAGWYTGGRKYMHELMGWSIKKAGNLLRELEAEGFITKRLVAQYGASKTYAYQAVAKDEIAPAANDEMSLREGQNVHCGEGQNGTRGEGQNVTQNLKIELKAGTTNSNTNEGCAFERAWAEYPRKEGKQEAQKAYKRSIKNGATSQEILEGVKRYVSKLKHEKTEPRYIMQGSTFFHQERWRDEFTTEYYDGLCHSQARELVF